MVVGWCGCECDGLVSNTLSLSMSATSTHPSMVSHSPVCFKAIVFVATSISVLVLLCCPTFALCPNPFFIDNCYFIACTVSCVCVGFVDVCCVMSSDGVRGVDDAVCLAVHSQKKAAQHTALFACDGVHKCVMLYGGGCERVVWCGGVVGCREKRGRGKHTVKQKQKKDFSQNHFFSLFPFLPPLFHPLFSPCLPLFHHHSLPIHTLTCFSCFTHGCIRCEPKAPMTQHLILFIVFSFCSNSLFLFFPSSDDSMLMQSQSNTIESSNNIHFT